LGNASYQLNKRVFVLSPAVLTIQPGCIIYGESNGFLIIERGASIQAIGSSSNPIIFTSSKPAGTRQAGDWGGIYIAGNGSQNVALALFEGLNVPFGGLNPTDNSGTLQYVRIEFAGSLIQTGVNAKALALGALGSGTTINHIQISHSLDDALAIFGGSVNIKNIVAYRPGDDAFDIDWGYSGTMQFLVGIFDPNTNSNSSQNGFEIDGNPNSNSNPPFTAPVISNASIIGPKQIRTTSITSNYFSSMLLRRNCRPKIFNSFFTAFPNGVTINGTTTATNATNNDLEIKSCRFAGVEHWGGNGYGSAGTIFSGPPANGLADPSTPIGVPFLSQSTGGPLTDTFVNTAGFNNTSYSSWSGSNTVNSSIFTVTNPGLILPGGSPLATGSNFSYGGIIGNPFITAVSYVGAFGTSDWTAGWSNFNPINSAYSSFIPTITNFSPKSGPIGTTVTITGTNFSTTPANNVVYFGGVRSTVTSASSGSLTVQAPAGQSIGKISVTVGKLTAYSALDFVPTFPAALAPSFASAINLTGGSNMLDVTTADIDGDGKPDLLSTIEGTNSLRIYRNQIPAGASILASHFLSFIDLPTSATPGQIKTADFNGDGKLDITVVLNGGVDVFLNNSSPGSIASVNFSRIFINITDQGVSVHVGDADRDGKPDISGTNIFNSFLFRNTFDSIQGWNSSSFQSLGSVSSSGANVLFGGILADIDGDDSTDYITNINSSNAINFFRGRALPGQLNLSSFNAPFVLSTPGFALDVVFSDLDLDGKNDLLVSRGSSNSVSVYRNNASIGLINASTFPIIANIPSSHFANFIRLADLNGDSKPDILWSGSGGVVSYSLNNSILGAISSGNFSSAVTLSNSINSLFTLSDLNADGRPDLITANGTSNTLSIFQNNTAVYSITVPSISSNSVCTGAPLTVRINSTGTFNSGNRYRIQLSDASGSFANPVTIDSLISQANVDSIQVTIPSNTPLGSGYRVRVVSSNPFVIGSANPSDFSVNQSPSAPTVSNQSRCGNGTLTLTPSAGGSSYAFFANSTGGTALGTGSSFTTPSLSSTTTYYVASISAQGCLSSTRTPVQAIINPLPSAPIVNSDSICGSGSVVITPISGGSTYRFFAISSGGSPLAGGNDVTSFTTPVLTSTTTYFVASVSAQGCVSSTRTPVTITVNPAPPVPNLSDQTRCGAGFFNITPVTGSGTYRFYNSITGGSPLPGGNNVASFTTSTLSATTTYFVSSVGAGGCESSPRQPVNAVVNPLPASPVILGQSACAGQPVTLSPTGGSGFYSFYSTPSGGSPLPGGFFVPLYTIPSLGSTQTYFVSSVNTQGCESPRTPVAVTVSNFTTNLLSTPATCGQSNGSATLQVSGGLAPYRYSWTNGANDTLATSDSLASGNYQVTISDAAGCVQVVPVLINNTGGATISLTTLSPVSCAGGSNGSIDISISSGVPVSYQWNTGATTQDVTSLSAGVYQVTVIQSGTGCSTTQSFTVSQPPALQLQTQSFSTGCGNATGSAKVSITGGTAPYTRLWSTASTADSIFNLGAGVYTVLVTDSRGCQAQAAAAVSSNGAPVLTLDSIKATTCNQTNGAVYISATGGLQPYTYLWSNGSSAQDLLNVRDSSYSVTVTGANNCVATLSAVVPKQLPATPSICLVTVDSATETNQVVWEKPSVNPGVAFYRIYRESSAANVYIPIGTRHVDSLSVFTDSIASPDAKSWRYRISAVDSCGVESGLSPIHKTIHVLQGQGLTPGSVNLIWDNYEGITFALSTYYIYRRTSTAFTLIDSIAFQPFFNTRTLFSQPVSDPQLYYVIEAVPPGTCTATEAKSYNTTRSNSSRVNTGSVQGLWVSDQMPSVQIYPNPFSEQLQIETEGSFRYEVLDLLGRVIERGEGMEGRAVVKLNTMAQGNYLIKLYHGQGVTIHKVMKQ
jgi:hypothetical protein